MTTLSAALKLYFAEDASSFPTQNPHAVETAFGSTVLSRIEALAAEVGSLKPDWNNHTLASATKWAEGEMKRRHTDLDDGGAATLGWPFSYWNK